VRPPSSLDRLRGLRLSGWVGPSWADRARQDPDSDGAADVTPSGRPDAASADAAPRGRLTLWLVAAREAGLVALLGLGLGIAISLLFLLGGAIPGFGVANALRGGVVLFLLFHHVGMEVAMASLRLPHGAEVSLGLPPGASVDATVAFAFLGGMAIVAWRLAIAGRVVADVRGGRPRDRGLAGARVALPYALITLALGWTVSTVVRFPQTSPAAVHPSHVSSLLWPLAIAAVAGFVGGLRSGPDGVWGSDWWEWEDWRRRWRAAIAGSVRILLIGMGLAVVGFLVVALARPGEAFQYAGDGLSGGPLAGLGVAVLAVLALPNLALWVLAPAFGGCLDISSGFAFTTGPYCFLSYSHSPSHPLATRDYYWGMPNLGAPSPVFRVFMLVPLVAAVLGILHALRVGEVRTRREGMLVGTLTALVFIGMFLVALLLSTVTVRLNGPIIDPTTGYYRYGPQPLDAIQLGIEWVVVLGLVLGWAAGRRGTGRGS